MCLCKTRRPRCLALAPRVLIRHYLNDSFGYDFATRPQFTWSRDPLLHPVRHCVPYPVTPYGTIPTKPTLAWPTLCEKTASGIGCHGMGRRSPTLKWQLNSNEKLLITSQPKYTSKAQCVYVWVHGPSFN